MTWLRCSFLLLPIILFGHSSSLYANPARHPWFFTAEEIETAYRYQEKFGKGLRYPLHAQDCLLGKKKIVASYYGREFVLPCRFVTETIRHLREILEVGAARYLFPLDLDHAHLGIPKESWESKYRELPGGEIVPRILRDPDLVALYHSAEHLTAVDPETGKVDRETQNWIEKRNILGFYDGRSIEILPPHPKGFGVGMPDSYHPYGGFDFLASPRGRLGVFLEDDSIVFDLTLDISDVRQSRK